MSRSMIAFGGSRSDGSPKNRSGGGSPALPWLRMATFCSGRQIEMVGLEAPNKIQTPGLKTPPSPSR